MRSLDELKGARRQLFDAFPKCPDAAASLQFQRLLIDEILRTEHEQRVERAPDRASHLRAARIYGDALAFSLLSTYSIRQLSRNTGKAPYLSTQGHAFDRAVECAVFLADVGVPPLLADLTNVIRNGDVLGCADPDSPGIFECKLSKPSAHFARQGRRGRQLARLESIADFLSSGRGTIFGENHERVTITTAHRPDYGYSLVEMLVQSALEHRPIALASSVDEFYAVALIGELADVGPALRELGVRKSDHVALGSSLDPLLSGLWEVPPPVTWELSPSSRWALMEGDVAISHAVRLEAFVGATRDSIRILDVTELPGQIPWGFVVDVGDHEPIRISAKVVPDIIYCHETLPSARARLLDMAESVASIAV